MRLRPDIICCASIWLRFYCISLSILWLSKLLKISVFAWLDIQRLLLIRLFAILSYRMNSFRSFELLFNLIKHLITHCLKSFLPFRFAYQFIFIFHHFWNFWQKNFIVRLIDHGRTLLRPLFYQLKRLQPFYTMVRKYQS